MADQMRPGAESLENRINELSPQRRAALEKLLQVQGSVISRPAVIGRRTGAGTAPLSFGQQRLWFLDQLMPGNTNLNLNLAIRIREPVDEVVLERSLNEIVRRHESLRTIFKEVNGEPFQVVLPRYWLQLRLVDLRSLADSEREIEAIQLTTEEFERPFDLARGPLLRSSLLRMGEGDYIFLLTMHHIIWDGWSMGLFWSELSTIWDAFANSEPSPLPELPLQYVDFAVWQRDWLQGDVLGKLLAYWKKQLVDLADLQLPTDHPRPVVQSVHGAAHNFTVSPSLVAALRTMGHREGATLFMTLLAAFQTLLFRYAGQDDFVVGTFIANRNHAEIEGLIGFFVNTLVLRANFAGAPSFREVLRRVRKTTLDAYAHQDLPFAILIQELSPERDLSRNPLFQVAFQLLNAPTLGQEGSNSNYEVLEVQRETAILDLTVSVWENADGLDGEIEYNTDLFDAETVKRLAAHYQILLQSIVADPDQHVHDLPLLSDAERRQLLIEWNATKTDYPREENIVSLFEAQVARSPEATALVCEEERITYAELNSRSNRLARRLQALGVGPEVLVGICIDRSFDFVVVLLATFKAGGAYLPLDPSYPKERLAFMLKDAGASVLLTLTRFVQEIPVEGRKLFCLDADRELLGQYPDTSLANRLSPEQLAYVIYTSGSTGQPKGVAVEHRQLLNRVHWMWEEYPFAPDEVGCQKTAANFVDSIWEFFGPLLKGVPTVIIRDEALRDTSRLVEELARHRVTRIWLVPSLLRALLDLCPNLQERLPHLGFWVTTGEVLTPELFRRFCTRMPAAILYNLYGTSEVWDATWFDPTRETVIDGHMPIGRPIFNVQTYVLDDNLQPVPIGVPGELYVGGDGLARGYLNLPQLMAEKFIPNLFDNRAGARLYRTGDLVRYRSDGNIEFLDRLDRQVKIRGYRVEPSEVESILSRHPSVRQAVVVAREDSPGGPFLVAYVLPNRGREPAPDALHSFVREQLPEYMVPVAFVTLNSLPLTPSGKLDRLALPALDTSRPTIRTAYAVPRTPIEETLAGVWAQILGIERIGVRDNFFEIGGHSLLATRVMSRVRDAFNVDLPLRAFFENPTIAQLAELVKEARGRGEENRTQAIVRISRESHIATLLPGGKISPMDLRKGLRKGTQAADAGGARPVGALSERNTRAEG